ncbi:cell division protein ZapA [Pseudahrensia aquimaris]|uniref:Cell division protein ZapA n=1 Tax=Pseudahrensia aquimaris TaxID=744461 RepID=A0ABW3FCI2_9HYPH
MPQVAVQINGKTYRMACDEGQEDHLLDLAKRFDKTITSLKGSFGEIGDQRLTVMAGIMVQDELVELKRKIAGMEAELAELHREADSGSQQAEIAAALTKTAERIEAVTRKLA